MCRKLTHLTRFLPNRLEASTRSVGALNDARRTDVAPVLETLAPLTEQEIITRGPPAWVVGVRGLPGLKCDILGNCDGSRSRNGHAGAEEDECRGELHSDERFRGFK